MKSHITIIIMLVLGLSLFGGLIGMSFWFKNTNTSYTIKPTTNKNDHLYRNGVKWWKPRNIVIDSIPKLYSFDKDKKWGSFPKFPLEKEEEYFIQFSLDGEKIPSNDKRVFYPPNNEIWVSKKPGLKNQTRTFVSK